MFSIENRYDFETIDKINEVRFRGLEDYQVGSALFWEFHVKNIKQNHSVLRSFARIMLSSTTKKFVSLNSDSELCFVYSDDYKGHDDYKPWFYNVVSLFSDANCIRTGKTWIAFKWEILRNIMQWIKALNAFFDYKTSVYYASALAKKYSDFIDIKKEVERGNPKVITVIDSSHPTDNLITQYGKRMGIKTVTLQHGIYDDVDFLLRTDNDYYLIFGQQTFELHEMYKFKMDNLKLVGSPRLIGRDVSSGYSVDNNAIAVIMGTYVTEIDDIKMLSAVCSAAENLGMKVIAKLHPGCSREEYPVGTFEKVDQVIISEMSVDEVMEISDFATVTQSTVFVENLINCKPTFVYDCKDCLPIYSIHKEVLFESKDELEELINKARNDAPSMVKSMRDILSYYTETEDVAGKYRNFYNSLCDEAV